MSAAVGELREQLYPLAMDLSNAADVALAQHLGSASAGRLRNVAVEADWSLIRVPSHFGDRRCDSHSTERCARPKPLFGPPV